MPSLKGNIWKLYLFKIISGMAFFVPVIVLFWQDNGLSLVEIMLLQSLYAFSIVLLEIPTGYFADIFGRKKTLLFAGLFFALGMFIYGIGFNFWQFLIGEIVWSVGVALASGTDSAFVYDSLVDLKQEKHYKKVWGNAMFYYFISTSVAVIIGGFVGKFNFRATLFLSAFVMLILIPLTLSMKEPKRHKLIVKKGYLWELFKIVKFALVNNKKLKWLMIYSGIILGFNSAALWLYQPYFKLSGLDIGYFGLVFAAFNVIAALGSKYAHRVDKHIGLNWSLFLPLILIVVSYFLMSNFLFLFSFSFAFLQQFVRGFFRPVVTDCVNKLTKSEIRATVLSVQSMFSRVSYAIIIPFIGWIADVYTIMQAMMVAGIAALVIGIVIFLFLLKVNKTVA